VLKAKTPDRKAVHTVPASEKYCLDLFRDVYRLDMLLRCRLEKLASVLIKMLVKTSMLKMLGGAADKKMLVRNAACVELQD
jgi:hypothetical protein